MTVKVSHFISLIASTKIREDICLFLNLKFVSEKTKKAVKLA